MDVTIARNGMQMGPFPVEEVQRKLAAGEVALSDLAWRPGMGEWQPLGTVLNSSGIGGGAFGPPPASTFAAGAAYGYGAAQAYQQGPRTSGTAVASLICGLLGFMTWISGLGGIITGHIALSEIKKSGGTVGGRGLAIVGLITGYLSFIVLPVLFMIFFGFFMAIVVGAAKGETEKITTQAKLQTVDVEITQYLARHRKLPDTLEDLSLEQSEKTDSWGEPFVYRKSADEGGGDNYELHSKGPDKTDGTSDDVHRMMTMN